MAEAHLRNCTGCGERLAQLARDPREVAWQRLLGEKRGAEELPETRLCPVASPVRADSRWPFAPGYDGLTVEYDPADEALGRLPLAVSAGAGNAREEDLRNLLLRRLRFLCPLLAVLFGGPGIIVLVEDATAFWRPSIWNAFLYLFITLLLTGLVWSRHVLSLRQLRAIELLLVVMLATRIVARGYIAFWGEVPQRAFQAWRDTGAGQLLAEQLNHSALYLFMPAAIYLVAYGVCIPNTWQRCVIVVAALWSITTAVWVIGCLTNALPLTLSLSPDIASIVLMLTFAAALAVYGSHRIETLRHEALQARRLGQYVLRKRLGAGGMGEVYLADHTLLRRPCAIKLIRPERAGDPAVLQRFEREVQATATLTHPNAVQIFDYGRAHDGTFYYVMEYLPGLTLEELVKQAGPLPPGRVIHFLRQLCAALHEAHAIGLIHRDLKPSNVMICERGRTQDVAKLLDFGLVHAPFASDGDDRLTQHGTVIGTPSFLSPEQAGGGVVDARSDIYSLGALAYYLLAGQGPFAGRTPVKMLAAHLYEPPPPLSSVRADVPADLEAIILQCLAKNPADRFPDVRSLDQTLAECAAAHTWTREAAASWWQYQTQS